MTWTKFGDEFGDAASDLSDAAFRTHVEATMWSNRRLCDFVIPKGHVKRFAETDDPDLAIAELVETGWWQEIPNGWYIGCRFPEWQLERTVVEARRELAATRQRRHRLHAAGDHSMCTEKCSVARDEMRDVTRDPVRVGTERIGTEKEEPPPNISALTSDEEMWEEVRAFEPADVDE